MMLVVLPFRQIYGIKYLNDCDGNFFKRCAVPNIFEIINFNYKHDP